MNLLELEVFLEKIERIICVYFEDEDIFNNNHDRFEEERRERLDNYRSRLRFSNGDVINFGMEKNNLAHLLGIDTDYLANTGLFSGNSYEILKQLINKGASTLMSYQKSGNIDFNKFISKYANRKIENFKNNIKIDFNNVLFVCKYDSNKGYANGQNIRNMEYFIVRKEDDKYLFLSIVKNNNLHVPVSNQVFDTEEEMINAILDYTMNQELLVLENMSFKKKNGEIVRLFINQVSRKEKYNDLFKFSKQLFATPDVLSAYLASIDIIGNKNDNSSYNKKLISMMTEFIKNKQKIELELDNYKIQQEIKEIVESYNESLETELDKDGEYVKLKEEKEMLRVELDRALQELEKEKAKYKDMSKRYGDAQQEISELNEKFSEIRKIVI